MSGPTTPRILFSVWALPTSLAATMGISSRFLFLCLLRCVTSAGLASHVLCIQTWIMENYFHWVPPFGLLRITASSSSPKLIAGLHVLLRLSMPRHPPTALSSLNHTKFAETTSRLPLLCVSLFWATILFASYKYKQKLTYLILIFFEAALRLPRIWIFSSSAIFYQWNLSTNLRSLP
jgi:hypothetical protein